MNRAVDPEPPPQGGQRSRPLSKTDTRGEILRQRVRPRLSGGAAPGDQVLDRLFATRGPVNQNIADPVGIRHSLHIQAVDPDTNDRETQRSVPGRRGIHGVHPIRNWSVAASLPAQSRFDADGPGMLSKGGPARPVELSPTERRGECR